LGGCGGDSPESEAEGGAALDAEMVQELAPGSAEPIVIERYELRDPELAKRARRPAFRLAVDAFAAEPGVRRVKVVGLPGAVGFRAEHALVEEHLAGWNERYRHRGAFVLRYEDSFGYGGGDAVLVLPTTDDLEAVDAAGTDGVNWDISHRQILDWLRDLMKTDPFVVTGAGLDFVEGRFVEPPANADALAEKMYRFCPDIVDQGTGTVAALADELERGGLYLWWD
jgi:Domain of unknown function (DUF4253)